MEFEKIQDEIMDLRERTIRMETSIENLAKQQTAIDALAKSVQEIALSLRDLTIQTRNNTIQLEDMEECNRKKQFYVWSTVIGGILGALITYITSLII